MKPRKGLPKARKGNESSAANPLGRRTSAVKRQQKKEAITAAMEQSQRSGAVEVAPRMSAALGRAVKAAQRGRKKQILTEALEESQRETRPPRKPESETLTRTVTAGERLRKKEAITAAMTDSERRAARRGS